MSIKGSKHLFFILSMSCLIILSLRLISNAEDVTNKAKELQNLKKDAEKIRKEKKNIIIKERSLLTELKKIDDELNSKEKELNIYEKNLDESKSELAILENKLRIAQKNLKETQETLNKRLRAMYKFGYSDKRLNYISLIANSESISDINSKYVYISRIAELDKKLLAKAIEQRETVSYHKRLVEEKKQRIEYNKMLTEKAKSEIAQKKQSQAQTLNKVRKSKEELTKAQIEIEASINKLEKLMAQLRNAQKQTKPSSKNNYNTKPYYDESGVGLSGQIGRLPWPTNGEIIENQAPSMKGVTIRASHGADIKCVDDGIVDYARWFQGIGYGNMLIINHGNGYRTLYAHASEILVKEGQNVKKGQVIAKVGDTGSLNGTSLYFEVWRGTEALPTRRWLGK